VNPEEEKTRTAVGRICKKGGFKPGMKEFWVMEYQIIVGPKYDCWQIMTV